MYYHTNALSARIVYSDLKVIWSFILKATKDNLNAITKTATSPSSKSNILKTIWGLIWTFVLWNSLTCNLIQILVASAMLRSTIYFCWRNILNWFIGSRFRKIWVLQDSWRIRWISYLINPLHWRLKVINEKNSNLSTQMKYNGLQLIRWSKTWIANKTWRRI